MASADDGPRAAKRRRANNGVVLSTRTQPDRAGCYHITSKTAAQEGDDDRLAEEQGQATYTRDCFWDESVDRDVDRDMVGDDASLECCYGMLVDNPLKPKTSTPRSKYPSVRFQRPNSLTLTIDGDPCFFDIVCPTTCRIIRELEDFPGITTQLDCESQLDLSASSRKGKISHPWFLNIIIYGADELADVVGEFLSKYQRYLQDPVACDRNVVYRNPHLVTLGSDEVVMTDSFNSPLGGLEIEQLRAGPDLLARLMKDDIPLPETETPSIITTKLFVHQKQALTFLLRREQGWAMDGSYRDIWTKQIDKAGRIRYMNNISGLIYDEAPGQFRGGLLADDMGLGKTLTMLSLIAANQANHVPLTPINPESLGQISHPNIKTTLLIVPPPLIQAWEKQFNMHIRPNALKWRTFHGQNQADLGSLRQYDIVITTYHTLAAIWRKNNGTTQESETLFSPIWHRVILDEAHTIQNSQNQLSQACYAIRSSRRWAITGTPIQNKLTDFASIVRFLNVFPYSEPSIFDHEISRPWNQGDRQGFLRLKTLVRAITISRTKSVVKLPPRVDEIHHLHFSSAERCKYDAATKEIKALIDEAISSGASRGATVNALQRLNILRLICCHGLLARINRKGKTVRPLQVGLEWRFEDTLYDNQGGSEVCSQCGADLLEDLLEGFSSAVLHCQDHTKWERTLCDDCSSQFGSISPMPWNYRDRFDISDSSLCASPSSEDDCFIIPIESMSTKIKALAADLLKHSKIEKSVVFSFWTYTLDLVQLMLNNCNVPYLRIDGKVPLAKRAEVLKTFQTDNSVRVILVSITCGGAGLDLTAASRAYILEPHWNPMIEEQALCRVHRVGQRKPCTTIRYIMKASFEEQIVELQKRKRKLADITIGQTPLVENGIGLGTLDYLRSVLR